MSKELTILFEEAYVPQPGNIRILQEGFDENGNRKMVIKAVLQTANVLNRNKRIYPAEVLQSVVEQLLPKAKNGYLLCELDHPLPETSDTNVIKKRAATVSLKNAAAKIVDLSFDGNSIVGELEILNTDSGRIVQALVKDGVQIGFSLRALGQIQKNPDGTLTVTSLKAITYDIVNEPSHQQAVISSVNYIGENFSEFIKSMDEVLTEATVVGDDSESFSVIVEGNEGQVCTGDVCYRDDIGSIISYIIENVLADEKLKTIHLSI